MAKFWTVYAKNVDFPLIFYSFSEEPYSILEFHLFEDNALRCIFLIMLRCFVVRDTGRPVSLTTNI